MHLVKLFNSFIKAVLRGVDVNVIAGNEYVSVRLFL